MNKYDYSYSALSEEEKKEVEAVNRDYSTDNTQTKDDALSKMRKLNKKVRLPAEITAYIMGIVSVLVLGVGMCMCLEAIKGGIILGSVIGIAGIAAMVLSYQAYKLVLKLRKNKYRDEILEITEKLLDGRDKNGD